MIRPVVRRRPRPQRVLQLAVAPLHHAVAAGVEGSGSDVLDLQPAARRLAAGSTNSLWLRKKSTPMMANVTSARRNVHSNRRPWKSSCTALSPQHGIRWPPAPVKSGPLDGDVLPPDPCCWLPLWLPWPPRPCWPPRWPPRCHSWRWRGVRLAFPSGGRLRPAVSTVYLLPRRNTFITTILHQCYDLYMRETVPILSSFLCVSYSGRSAADQSRLFWLSI